MLVSRKTSVLIRLVTAEPKAGGQAPVHGVQGFDRVIPAAVADLERACARDLDLDLIALPQPKGFDHCGGQAHRQAIPSFTDLHEVLRMIYMSVCIWPGIAGVTRPG